MGEANLKKNRGGGVSQTRPNTILLIWFTNLPACIYMYLDYILIYPVDEPTYLGYLIYQHTSLPSSTVIIFCFPNPPVYLPTFQVPW